MVVNHPSRSSLTWGDYLEIEGNEPVTRTVVFRRLDNLQNRISNMVDEVNDRYGYAAQVNAITEIPRLIARAFGKGFVTTAKLVNAVIFRAKAPDIMMQLLALHENWITPAMEPILRWAEIATAYLYGPLVEPLALKLQYHLREVYRLQEVAYSSSEPVAQWFDVYMSAIDLIEEDVSRISVDINFNRKEDDNVHPSYFRSVDKLFAMSRDIRKVVLTMGTEIPQGDTSQGNEEWGLQPAELALVPIEESNHLTTSISDERADIERCNRLGWTPTQIWDLSLRIWAWLSLEIRTLVILLEVLIILCWYWGISFEEDTVNNMIVDSQTDDLKPMTEINGGITKWAIAFVIAALLGYYCGLKYTEISDIYANYEQAIPLVLPHLAGIPLVEYIQPLDSPTLAAMVEEVVQTRISSNMEDLLSPASPLQMHGYWE